MYGWTEDGTGLGIGVDTNPGSMLILDVATGTLTPVIGKASAAAWRLPRPSVAMVFTDESAVFPRAGHVEVRDTSFAQSRVVARFGGEGSFLFAPQWNPRSNEVLLTWACGEGVVQRAELVVVAAVRATRRALPTAGCVYSAAWNGDGMKIIYSDSSTAHVMNADGSGDREVFHPAYKVAAFAPR